MAKMYCEKCVFGSGFHAGFCKLRGDIRISHIDFMGGTVTLVEDPAHPRNEVLFVNGKLFDVEPGTKWAYLHNLALPDKL